jgi:hypothetical protein
MRRVKNLKTGSILGIATTVAPIVIDLAKYAYTKMRQLEEEKKRNPKHSSSPDSPSGDTKKGDAV